jgi:hypothetical protein
MLEFWLGPHPTIGLAFEDKGAQVAMQICNYVILAIEKDGTVINAKSKGKMGKSRLQREGYRDF